MRLVKVPIVQVLVKKTTGKVYRRKFKCDSILFDKISKTELVKRIGRKKWMDKIKITKDEDFVVWEYEGKIPVYIFRDGFYLNKHESDITDDDLNTVYRCASILAKAKLVDGFRIL